MAVNSELAILLTAKDRTGGQFRKVQRQIATLTKNVDKMGKSFRRISLGNIGTTLGFTAMGAATAGVGMQFAMMRENAELAFRTLLKDGAKGTQFLKDLEAFALKTPFELEGLVDASRKLLGFGFAAADVIPILTDVGDAVGAMGGGAEMVGRITTALGQMQTKGKASAEELMQLAEAGIPVWQLLRENVDELFGAEAGGKFRAQMQAMVDRLTAKGVTPADALAQAQSAGTQSLMKMVSGGKLPAAKAIAAIRKGMAQKFGGLGAQQAETMSGELGALSEAWKALMGDMVQGAFGPGKTAISGLTDMLAGLRSTVEGLPDGFKQVLGIGTVLAGGLGAIGGLAGGLGGVGGVLGSLFGGGGGGGNPILPLLLGIAIAIGLLLAPLEAIRGFLSGALHVLVDNWPGGGGGSGGGLPGIPVVAEVTLTPSAREDVQRQIDAWPDLQKMLKLWPSTREETQAALDAWPQLQAKLGLLPDEADTQRRIGDWADLKAKLGLREEQTADVQRRLDGWQRLLVKMGLVEEPQAAVQGRLNAWPALLAKLWLGEESQATVQGRIGAWPALLAKMGLGEEPQAAVQSRVGAWPALIAKLWLAEEPRDVVQGRVGVWPSLLAKLGLTEESQGAVQERIGMWPELGAKMGLVEETRGDVQERVGLWSQLLAKTGLVLPASETVQSDIDRYGFFGLGTSFKLPGADFVQTALDSLYQGLVIRPRVEPVGTPGGIDPGGKFDPGPSGAPGPAPPGLRWSPNPGGAGGAWVPNYASGGLITASGLAMVHAGERVVPAEAVRGGGGSTVVNFNNYGVLAGNDAEAWVRGIIDRNTSRGAH